MGTPERVSASEASTVEIETRRALAAIALALPPGWCATVRWDGQTVITPVRGYNFSYGDPVAAPDGTFGRIRYSWRYRVQPRRVRSRT